MKTPRLSVLIDTYNHERYIEQAVVSAIEQDFPAADYEILVVDDGSTDRTPEIVRKFAPRVRLLTKKNGGQASAFNAAFPELRGDIVAFLDGDDWFAPGKLTAVMNALEEHPEAASVGHGHYEVHEETNEVKVHGLQEAEFFHLATREAAREGGARMASFVYGFSDRPQRDPRPSHADSRGIGFLWRWPDCHGCTGRRCLRPPTTSFQLPSPYSELPPR